MDKEYIVIGKIIGRTKRRFVFQESKGGEEGGAKGEEGEGGKEEGGKEGSKGEGGYVLKFYVDSVEELKMFKRYFMDDEYGNKEELNLRVGVFGNKVYGHISNYAGLVKKGILFKDKDIYINRSELPELASKSGEYYQIDLRGSECILENGQKYGEVEEVVNYGAGDLLKIRQGGEERRGREGREERREERRERGRDQIKYLPFRRELIKGVEVSKKRVYLKDIEGYD